MKINQLDGIRGIAVLFVLYTHMLVWNTEKLGLIINLGQAGVYVFFVLSSYLMFTQFLKYDLTEKKELKKFYVARFFRVYPLYFVAVTSVALFYYFSDTGDGFLVYLYNLLFLQQVTQFTDVIIMALSWTLVIEIQLYIFVPILGILFFGKQKQHNKFRVFQAISMLFVTSIIVRFLFLEYSPLENWFFLYLDLFGVGALIAYRHVQLRELKQANKPLSFILLILFVIISPLTSPVLLPDAIRYTIILPIYAILLYFVFDYLLLREQNILQKICSVNILVKAGIYGYSIYLVHGIVVQFNTYILNDYGFDMGPIVMGTTSVCISIITYHVIEVPFKNYGTKIIKSIEKKS